MRAFLSFSALGLSLLLATPPATAQTGPKFARDYVYGPGSRLLTTIEPDTMAPTAPTGLSASVLDCEVDLGWNAATDIGSGVASYTVYRGGGSIGTTSGTSFADTHAGCNGATYTYTVAAKDAAGNLGPQSSGITVNYLGCSTCCVRGCPVLPPPLLFLQTRLESQTGMLSSAPRFCWLDGLPKLVRRLHWPSPLWPSPTDSLAAEKAKKASAGGGL